MWIALDDYLPEENKSVIIAIRISGSYSICEANYRNGYWYDHVGHMPHRYCTPEYWMPWPEDPQIGG